ncbi:MAG TPA: hypothetical protein VJY62_03155 [Bacteroidia bacterium]|nr:hypothetical protein [Bacteroidia bacterium]
MRSYIKSTITNLAGINSNAGYMMLEEQTRIHQLFISTLNTARKRKKPRIMHLYLVHPFCLSADEDMSIRLPRGLP